MTETIIIANAACCHGVDLEQFELYTNACKEHNFIFLYGLKRCIKLLLNLGYLLSTSAESIEQLLLCI